MHAHNVGFEPEAEKSQVLLKILKSLVLLEISAQCKSPRAECKDFGMLAFLLITENAGFLAAPTHGPSNLTVVDIGPTHIHIRWDHPPNDTHQGIVRQYNIYVDVEETQQTHFYTTTAENRELFLTSLHPYYTYHMRVTAVTVEEGNSTLLSARTHESGMYLL